MNRYKLRYVIEQVQANPWVLEKMTDPREILVALSLHKLLTPSERGMAAREIADFMEGESLRERHQMVVCVPT